MRLLLAVVLCGILRVAQAGTLDVSPVLLPEERVGVLITNGTAKRVSVEKISVVSRCRHCKDTAMVRRDFQVAPFDLMPGAIWLLPLAGLSPEIFVDWLPHKWEDVFGIGDVAEVSFQRRGCVSCDYQPDVWAWHIALPFILRYEARFDGVYSAVAQEAYVHFWKQRKKGESTPSIGFGRGEKNILRSVPAVYGWWPLSLSLLSPEDSGA